MSLSVYVRLYHELQEFVGPGPLGEITSRTQRPLKLLVYDVPAAIPAETHRVQNAAELVDRDVVICAEPDGFEIVREGHCTGDEAGGGDSYVVLSQGRLVHAQAAHVAVDEPAESVGLQVETEKDVLHMRLEADAPGKKRGEDGAEVEAGVAGDSWSKRGSTDRR